MSYIVSWWYVLAKFLVAYHVAVFNFSLITFGIGLGIHAGRALFLLGHAIGRLDMMVDKAKKEEI